jgi:hypothetical protein
LVDGAVLALFALIFAVVLGRMIEEKSLNKGG